MATNKLADMTAQKNDSDQMIILKFKINMHRIHPMYGKTVPTVPKNLI